MMLNLASLLIILSSKLLKIQLVVTENSPGMSTRNHEGHIQLDVAMKNMTRYEGEVLRLKCEITGFPLPKYSWYKDDQLLFSTANPNPKYSSKITPWGSRLRVADLTVDDSGRYTCEGRNRFGHNSTSGFLVVKSGSNPYRWSDRSDNDERSLALDPDDQLDLDAELEYENFDGSVELQSFVKQDVSVKQGGFCQSYKGVSCFNFLSNKKVFVINDKEQDKMEKKVTDILTRLSVLPNISDTCWTHILPALCYTSFPQCNEKDKLISLNPLCPQNCQKLQEHWCSYEYKSSAGDSVIRELYAACSQTQISSSSKLLSAGCIDLEHLDQLGILESERCYNGTGQRYRGTSSTTITGSQCVTWSSILQKGPQTNPLLLNLGRQLTEKNYCRNFDNSQSSPWCFTSRDQKIIKETCQIPPCGSPAGGIYNSLPQVVYVLVPSFFFLLLIMTIVLCSMKICRSGKDKKSASQSTTSVVAIDQIQMTNLMSSDVCKRLHEYPFTSVVIQQELGEGMFGKVFRGELLLDVSDSCKSRHVAVLMLNLVNKWTARTKFMKEMEVISDFSHINVMCLVGVSTSINQTISILFELPNNSLVQLLLSTSPYNVHLSSNSQNICLKPLDMLSICIQAATAMGYLESKQYLHADIAARNVYITDSGVVKLSTMRIVNTNCADDYWTGGEAGNPTNHQEFNILPIRWMPPEAIFNSQFSSASDVWSFGVLLWEVYTYGLRPYNELSDSEVLIAIRSNQILPCPHQCPQSIYSLMKKCWHPLSQRRPTFQYIRQKLLKIKNKLLTDTSAVTGMTCESSSTSSGSNQNRFVQNLNSTLTKSNNPNIIYQNTVPCRFMHPYQESNQLQNFHSYQPYIESTTGLHVDQPYHIISADPSSSLSSRSRSPATTNSNIKPYSVASDGLQPYRSNQTRSPQRQGFHAAFMRSTVADISKAAPEPVHL